jgi:hypothetical protein
MVVGSVQRLAGKSGERLLQLRCLCVPWRHRSSPCIGMCRCLGDGRAVMLTAGTAASAADTAGPVLPTQQLQQPPAPARF